MNKTKIEYLTHSWNPIAMRCTAVSEGCANCWHLDINNRFKLHSGLPELRKKELDAPYKLRKPSRIGTQFMGDLFHEDLQWEQIQQVFAVMHDCPQHTFLLLTKRPDRLTWFHWTTEHEWRSGIWPLPNVWLGVTAENQKRFDERWECLKQISALILWVSHEPALGPIVYPSDFLALGNKAWLVSGSESGPGARPSRLDWFRQDKDQCFQAGVPFFFKQYKPLRGRMVHMPEIDGKIWNEYPK